MVAAREAATSGLDALEENLSRPRRLSRMVSDAARHLLRIVGSLQPETHQRVRASLGAFDQVQS